MPRGSSSLRSEAVVNGYFASASRRKVRDPGAAQPRDTTKVHTHDWQQRAWYYYDIVPEFRYAIGWIGNMCSRGKLVVKRRLPNGKIEDVERGPAIGAIDTLFGGRDNQPEMLRLIGTHLSMSGDGYLVGEDGEGGEDESWDVHSNLRLKPSGGGYRLEGEKKNLKTKAVVIRFWRGHPLERKQGDSNVRAALVILNELDLLTKRIASDAASRLTGNGILFLPNEITFPAQTVTKADGTVETIQRAGADGFQQMLVETSMVAMGDQESASANTPIVSMVPAEAISKIKHVTFWSEFDAQMQSLREEAIKRLGTGLDMPPEVLTGTADVNHWGAWQVDEAAIKVHAEPLLNMIAAGLTSEWLRPYLKAFVKDAVADQYFFQIDTSDLRVRPNRSKEAFELWDRGVLSDAALLRENGFTDDDLPSDAEKLAWLTRKVAGGTTSPEVVEAAIRALGIKLDVQRAQAEAGDPERPTPSLDQHPARDIPDPEESESIAARAAAAGVIVYRALERAGNKLKNQGHRLPGVPAAELYRHTKLSDTDADQLLVDAFTCPAELSMGCDPETLQAYTRTLLVTGKPLDSHMLSAYLRVNA